MDLSFDSISNSFYSGFYLPSSFPADFAPGTAVPLLTVDEET
jgi:hypothetical protein